MIYAGLIIMKVQRSKLVRPFRRLRRWSHRTPTAQMLTTVLGIACVALLVVVIVMEPHWF